MSTHTCNSHTAADTSPSKAKPVLTLGADLSPAVASIEKAYRMIQKAYPDAPDVTIVVKRDEKAWGHTTVAKVWAPGASADTAPADRFELMISGENLRRGAVAVAGTLLHEAAHARNLAAGTLDTDVNGRHNLKFKATAEEHGLTVEEAGWHGWTRTELGEAGQKRWKALVKVLALGLSKSAASATPNLDHLGKATPAPAPVPTEGPTGKGPAKGIAVPPKRGNRNLTKAVCSCGFSIRASRGVLDEAAPTCSKCGELFTPVD